MARLCMVAGATDEDIVQIAFGYGLFTGALGLHYGLEKIGATVVPTSSGNTEKQIMLMQDFKTTALVSTPSYAQYIGEVAREMGAIDNINLRLGLFGSEGCTEEMRTQIEKSLNLFATDNYGMSELMGPGVSGECECRCGMHINRDHFLLKLLTQTLLRFFLVEKSENLLLLLSLKRVFQCFAIVQRILQRLIMNHVNAAEPLQEWLRLWVEVMICSKSAELMYSLHRLKVFS